MAKVMLPKQIDPFQLADNNTTLKGDLSLSEMVRLTEFLCEKKGDVHIHLEFGRDALNFAFMRGSIKTQLKLVCQRCGLPMSLSLEIPVEDSPVHSDEEAQQLPENYEPLLLTGDTMSLIAMVEEEILLSIPIVPKHSIAECSIKPAQLIELEEKKEDKPNPFSDLKKLLRE
jgi:uncharacterized protein